MDFDITTIKFCFVPIIDRNMQLDKSN